METWGVTMQEKILDSLYEGVAGKVEGFQHDLFGVTEKRAEAVLYIRDPEGKCWEITAKEHNHG